MKPLASNAELYEYMTMLSKMLEERGSKTLAEAVFHASQTAAGNMSTEFLGETRIALRRVVNEGRRVLTKEERDQARDVLLQLEQVFKQSQPR
jgi:CRISPR/Cas system-associated protein Csm6